MATDEVLVAALLESWGRTKDAERDETWRRTAERIVEVVDVLRPRPAAAEPGTVDLSQSPLTLLLEALKTQPKDNVERVRMAEVVIGRVRVVRDTALKAVWATRTGRATASDLARHVGMSPGEVNTVIHNERERR